VSSSLDDVTRWVRFVLGAGLLEGTPAQDLVSVLLLVVGTVSFARR
jgi:hypothetical protein